MSGGGTHNYYGDNVNMHGGTGNVGMVKNQSAPAQAVPDGLEQAVRELVLLIQELRGQVPEASAQAIDDSLPAITADGSAQPQQRHGALMAVAGIAATVGAVGQPVLEAVNRVLELLGVK
ncbi:hypothetical protein [Streptomyces sp. NBC_01304]|uniref:hypothetical protein n=1 Tax=Streptomyces sp. NBC_01304 TaxID=2903818 RepID=UPI002E13CFF1|nr:hypothetical protein OG430_22720 [Streptomyces sp. NBC_01304]